MILIIYIIVLSTALSGILSLALLYWKNRIPGLKALISSDVFFILGLSLVLFDYYLTSIAGLSSGGTGKHYALTVMGISAVINTLCYVSLLIFTIRCSSEVRILKKITAFLFTFCTAGGIIHPLIFILFGLRLEWLSVLNFSLVAFSFLSLGVFLIVSRPEKTVQAFYIILGVCCLMFAPLSILELVLEQSRNRISNPLSLDFLFAALLNTGFVISAIVSLKIESAERSEKITLPDYLTGREKEMVRLIALGWSNKEIAYKLQISPATVRTHIYNLYRKTGAKSRVDLLRITGINTTAEPI